MSKNIKRKYAKGLRAGIMGVFFLFCAGIAMAETGDEEILRRAEKIAGYLQKAEVQLDRNNFDKARSYAEGALAVDEKSRRTRVLLEKIDEAERIYEEEQERFRREEGARRKQEEEARMEAQREKEERKHQAEETRRETKHEKELKKKAEAAVRRQAKKEAKRKRFEEKIKKYISISREYLFKEDYSSARCYAYKAREEAPENSEVAELIADIDKEEMFGVRQGEELARKKKVIKALEVPEEDTFHKYDEGKSWIDHVTGVFKKKTCELGDIQEGREYTIDECVELALRRSQRMIVSDEQIALAEMRVWEMRRELFPAITGKIERSTGKIGAGSQARHYEGEKYQVELEHTVFDGLGSWYKVRQYQANLEIIKLEREKIKNEIIAETKTAYYNLDKAIKALEVQRKLKEMANRLYDITDKSYQQELVPRVEYLKIKGQSIQADFHDISAGEDVSLAEMILFHAMNMEPDQYIKIKPVEEPGQPLSIGLENCYRLALANRPDFIIKEKTLEYYELERKMMKAKGWPKITFSGSFGQAFEVYQPTEKEAERRGLSPEWFAGVRGSIPLWGNTLGYNYVREKWPPVVSAYHGTESATSYFSIKVLDDLAYFSNLDEARAGFESAKYEYLKDRNAIMLEVKEAHFKYRKALLHMDVARAKAEHQQMYVDVLDERRRFGEMEASKVIEEAEKLATEEYGVVQGNANYFLALTELNKATGVPDYFKPEYENREYDKWKGELAELRAAEEWATRKVVAETRGEAKEEEMILKRAEKIAGYLVQAQAYLSKNNFSDAYEYVQKALQLDPENKTAKQLLMDIEKAELE